MSRLKRAIIRYARTRPSVRIVIGGELYLERFYLLGQARNPDLPASAERLAWLPTVWVHRFARPDADRELHNHPWGWALSVVLRGAYTEERLGWPARVVRRFNVITAGTWHRVAKLHGGEVWTLFVTGKPVRSWGFLASARVVPWRDYVEARDRDNSAA